VSEKSNLALISTFCPNVKEKTLCKFVLHTSKEIVSPKRKENSSKFGA
jgi:hypothetical protein